MEETLFTCDCGLFGLDPESKLWTPVCENRCNARLTKRSADGVFVLTVTETQSGRAILSTRITGRNAITRTIDVLVSILADTGESYGLHCLTRESADAFMACAVKQVFPFVKAQQDVRRDQAQEGTPVAEKAQEPPKPASSDRPSGVTLKEKKTYTIKAIPVLPSELVVRQDLLKLAADVNTALEQAATREEVRQLRDDVMARLDRLENILMELCECRDGADGRAGE